MSFALCLQYSCIAELHSGRDATGEAQASELAATEKLSFSVDSVEPQGGDVYVVAVSTPAADGRW